MIPRWLIDDTAGISEAAVYVAHTRSPRFVGELVDEGEAAALGGVTISAPLGQVLAAIEWLEPPVFDAGELARSLAEALEHHDAVRGAR